VSPTPARDAAVAMPMKLAASVASTLGRSSVNNISRVRPLKAGAVASAML